MFYKGHHRQQIRALREQLVELLLRDDRLIAKPSANDNGPLLFTGDSEVREAVELLIQRCQVALSL